MNEMDPQNMMDEMIVRMTTITRNIERLDMLSAELDSRDIKTEDVEFNSDIVDKFMETLEAAGKNAAKYNKLKRVADALEAILTRVQAADQARNS